MLGRLRTGLAARRGAHTRHTGRTLRRTGSHRPTARMVSTATPAGSRGSSVGAPEGDERRAEATERPRGGARTAGQPRNRLLRAAASGSIRLADIRKHLMTSVNDVPAGW